MAYSLETKEKAVALRKRGYSLRELHKRTGVAKSTLSDWMRDVILTENGRHRLLTVIKKGQYVNAENMKARTKAVKAKLLSEALEELSGFQPTILIKRLLCVLIYWCEGAKADDKIAFTNSDPYLTRLFIDLLVEGFGVERGRLTACLHLHEYHDPRIQTEFWSKKLNLNLSQFRKPYLKPHTAKRKRENYPGCIAVCYHNTIMARKLLSLAKAFLRKGA